MQALYVRAMDRLYWLCILVCIVSVVAMTVLIFTGVVMRYVFATGARFAEPMSIFFAVQLTMYGAAVCYRAHAHLRLSLFVDMLPEQWRRLSEYAVQGLLAALAILMIVYGVSLTRTTWFQSYPEFTYVRVGLVYSAIPGSGVIFLLFIIEALFFRGPDFGRAEEVHRADLASEQQTGRMLQRRRR